MFAALLLGATAGMIALLSRSTLITPDFPWLWRTGQWIIDHRALPATDPFSWTAGDRPVVPHQWLFELLLAAIERVAGFAGLSIFYLAAAAGIYLVAPLAGAVPRPVRCLPIIAVSAVALILLPVNLTLRPMLAGAAMLLLQYILLDRCRLRRLSTSATAAGVALLYVLWANLHSSFVVGLILLAVAGIGDALERAGLYRFRPADPSIEGEPLRSRFYGLLLLVGVTATLVNPAGIGLHIYIAAFAQQAFFRSAIQEMAAADLGNAFFMLWLVLIGLALWTMRRPQQVVRAADLLQILLLALATLIAGRMVVWSVVLLVLVLPRALYQAERRSGRRLDPGPSRRALAVASALVSVILPLIVTAFATPAWREGNCHAYRPAMAKIAEAAAAGAGPLFNDPTSGSCLLLLDPPPPVFIDTRFDLYGLGLAHETTQLLLAEPGWADRLAARGVGLVMVEQQWALAKALAGDPRYELLYKDKTVLVARRR
ncbi:MAG: hypothetical protein QOK29_4848 [Rhodospirillaceae bacterium]|nr:hypothetical protein [Rhodospirillaceae bacterium]